MTDCLTNSIEARTQDEVLIPSTTKGEAQHLSTRILIRKGEEEEDVRLKAGKYNHVQ
jgi:hypothetical protein